MVSPTATKVSLCVATLSTTRRRRPVELSLTDAARLLGKTPRQVRYLIKTGRLAATKDGVRWRLDSAALPLSEGQLRARARKAGEIRDAVDDALGPHGRLAGRRYSVRDLRAFSAAAPLARQVAQGLGADHPAALALRDLLVALSQGCHRFHDRDKREAYVAAREHAARAAALLLLAGHPEAEAWADRVEGDVMVGVTGLVRRTERPRGGA